MRKETKTEGREKLNKIKSVQFTCHSPLPTPLQWKKSVKAVLTNIRPLRYAAGVNFLAELRFVIIDVMKFDDELGLRLQLVTRPLVDNSGPERIKRLLLAVQAACSVQVTVILINDKEGTCTLTREDILHRPITAVHV